MELALTELDFYVIFHEKIPYSAPLVLKHCGKGHLKKKKRRKEKKKKKKKTTRLLPDLKSSQTTKACTLQIRANIMEKK